MTSGHARAGAAQVLRDDSGLSLRGRPDAAHPARARRAAGAAPAPGGRAGAGAAWPSDWENDAAEAAWTGGWENDAAGAAWCGEAFGPLPPDAADAAATALLLTGGCGGGAPDAGGIGNHFGGEQHGDGGDGAFATAVETLAAARGLARRAKPPVGCARALCHHATDAGGCAPTPHHNVQDNPIPRSTRSA